MLERRKHERRREFASGTVAGGLNGVPFGCVIRNLSESGALLLLDEPGRAPVELELCLRDGVRPVRIVWRSETEVGVAFAADLAETRFSPASVICLDAARRARGFDDDRRLVERIARFVRPSRRPDAG